MSRKGSVHKLAFTLTLGCLLLSGCAARFPRIETAAYALPPAPLNPANEGAKHQLNGVIFTLPKTLLAIDVGVEHKKQSEGIHCRFNNLFFPGAQSAVPCSKKPTDTIEANPEPGPPSFKVALNSIGIASRGVPDSAKRFILPIGAKAMVDSTDSLELTEGGTVTGAESSRTDRTGEVVLATLNTAATLVGKLAAGARSFDPPVVGEEKFLEALVKDVPAGHALVLRENYARLTMKEKEKYIATLPVTTPQFQEIMQARKAWDDILTIEETQKKILGGDDSDGPNAAALLKANNVLLDNIGNQNFFGVVKTTLWNPSFDIIPAAVPPAMWKIDLKAGKINLFRIGDGCFDNVSPDLAKNILPPSLTCKSDKPGTVNADLEIVLADLNQLASVIDNFYRKPSQTSYPFTIPASVKVSVTGFNNVPPPAQTAALAQWGTLNHFPVGKGAKGRTLKVTYYEATGALKSVKFTSDAPLNKSVIDSLSGSANSILDGQLKADANAAAAAKASAASSDELAKLVKQRQILEEKDKIAKLCATLGVSCGN